jgi:hypothetical protein
MLLHKKRSYSNLLTTDISESHDLSSSEVGLFSTFVSYSTAQRGCRLPFQNMRYMRSDMWRDLLAFQTMELQWASADIKAQPRNEAFFL